MNWQRELRWMRRRVGAQDHELRLDRWLRHQFPGLPQSFLQSQLRKRKIRLQPPPAASAQAPPASPSDGSSTTTGAAASSLLLQSARANSVLYEGAVVAIDAHLFCTKLQRKGQASDGNASISTSMLEQPSQKSPRQANTQHQTTLQDLIQRVVYQDKHFLVLNKPHGLAVQEGSALSDSLTRYLSSLAAALKDTTQCEEDDPEPLKLVHRLDKETSGALVLARSRRAAAKFSELLRRGDVQKTYEALVCPAEPDTSSPNSLKTRWEGQEIALSVDGKPARTLVERVLRQNGVDEPTGTWLQLKPVTGRKRQLREHCARALGAPIVGDDKYGGSTANRLYLHAKRIRFPDPFAATHRVLDVRCSMSGRHRRAVRGRSRPD